MRPGQSQPEWQLKLSTCLHENGTNITTFSIYSPLPGNFLFYMAFVSICVYVLFQCQGSRTMFQCQGRNRSEMYLCLHSSSSEFMLVWSQSARSSRRNDLRPVWVIFVPVSCKHYDRNEMVPVWHRSGLRGLNIRIVWLCSSVGQSAAPEMQGHRFNFCIGPILYCIAAFFAAKSIKA